MSFNILLYGATGFSGRLIAARASSQMAAKPYGSCRMILAGRNGAELRKVAADTKMPFRTFSLDNPVAVDRALDGVDLVLNAAGPFAFTALPLARAALRAGCHYVDINGELDVYRALDDFAEKAYRLGIAMVCGAAASAGASDVLLDIVLKELGTKGTLAADAELGAVRIAMVQTPDFSRGSAAAALLLLREQVLVVRKGVADDGRGGQRQQMVFWHEPVGKLERTFRFRAGPRDQGRPGDAKGGPRIASAANLIDTPTARRTVDRNGRVAHAIESYVETGPYGRIAYQVGGMLSPLLALPGAKQWIRMQTSLLPEGPRPEELRTNHACVLEIEDVHRKLLAQLRLVTPNVYVLTAQIAVEVACEVARSKDPAIRGWVTPAQALGLTADTFLASSAFEGCSVQMVA